MGYSTDPRDYGDDCSTCHLPGETPKDVYASWEEIIDCNADVTPPPPPLNDSVMLTQVPGYPCDWDAAVNNWLYEFYADPGFGSYLAQRFLGFYFFSGTRPNSCESWFENDILTCEEGHLGAGGIGIVMWNVSATDHSIGSLLAAINMEPEAETKFELWPAAEGKGMVRFARKKDATNILILVEPTEL